MQLEGYLSIEEAAKRLGVSSDTVRRRIKRGDLRAEKQKGPYGYCWMIPESEIRIAQEITEVVPVNRPVAIPDLVDAIAARLDGKLSEALSTLAEEQARTRAEVEALRQELAATRETQERIERSIEERDRKLTEALRALTEKEKHRGWWKKIFSVLIHN